MATYLTIADALNDGIKKILGTLSSEDQAAFGYVESFDIAVTLNTLSKLCMIASVGDSEAAEALEEAWKNESLTDANAAAKFVEALIALHNKANPLNPVPEDEPEPESDPEPDPDDDPDNP